MSSAANLSKKDQLTTSNSVAATGAGVAESQWKVSSNASATAQDNDDDRTSIVSIVCRICFDDNKDEAIITPCKCKGTVAFVHRSCLEKWLSESHTTACELCNHVYETERVPRYTVKESIWRWIRNQPTNLGFRVRHVRCDLIACSVLTPLAIIITYICLFSADYYNHQKFHNIPTARWTSISLLIMIAIMLFGYYIWVYVVVGYHGRMWYYWWQRECIVRYIPPGPVSANLAPAANSNQLTATTIEEESPNMRDVTTEARIVTPSPSADLSLGSQKPSIHESSV